MPEAGYEHFETEADVGVRAWGATPGEAFAQAARGVLALIVTPDDVERRESREVRAQGETPETLLVSWINECLYVHEIEGFAVRDVEVVAMTGGAINGALYGEPLDVARHRTGAVVKAATHHGVVVTSANRWHEVRVVVDM